MGVSFVESKKAPFAGGMITVQLQGDQISFQAGQVITGWVHFYLYQPCFPAQYLTIGLYGNEQAKFRKRHRRRRRGGMRRRGKGRRARYTYYWKTHYGHKNIASIEYPLQAFMGQMPMPGMYTFPFTM